MLTWNVNRMLTWCVSGFEAVPVPSYMRPAPAPPQQQPAGIPASVKQNLKQSTADKNLEVRIILNKLNSFPRVIRVPQMPGVT